MTARVSLALAFVLGASCLSAPKRLDPPHDFTDVQLTVVESSEPDALKAIAAAWSGEALTPNGEPIHWPATHGWDEEVSASFTNPAKQTHVRAEVRRVRARTFVMLAEASEATLSKREAQLDRLVDELAPSDLRPESFAGRRPRAIDSQAFEAFLVDAMKQLGVPGAGVALVQNGKVIFEKTWGTGTLGRDEPVTADTLFLMASITKPMTTFLQAALVDAGTFTWNSRVTTLLPGFRLADPKLTAQLELWHMSCACTGMPRRDIENLVEYGNVTAEQRLASMREMQPTTGLGETYQYSNLMVAAGGFAAAHAWAPTLGLNEAYVKAMDAVVFAPLGMRTSTADFTKATARPHATPHALDLDGQLRPLPIGYEGNVVPIAPAGAVWSTLHDMEQYAMAELSRGRSPLDGKRVVSEANYLERARPRTKHGYGLGIGVEQHLGLTILGHDGGSDGFGTSLLLFPDLQLGLVVLTNARNGSPQEQLPFNAATKRKLMELMFDGARPIAGGMITFALQTRRLHARQQGEGVERRPDPAWLAKLSGRYESTNLGTLEIHENVFDVGEWQSHFGRKGEALILLDPPFAGTPLAFDEASGTITLPDPQTKYVFTKNRQ